MGLQNLLPSRRKASWECLQTRQLLKAQTVTKTINWSRRRKRLWYGFILFGLIYRELISDCCSFHCRVCCCRMMLPKVKLPQKPTRWWTSSAVKQQVSDTEDSLPFLSFRSFSELKDTWKTMIRVIEIQASCSPKVKWLSCVCQGAAPSVPSQLMNVTCSQLIDSVDRFCNWKLSHFFRETRKNCEGEGGGSRAATSDFTASRKARSCCSGADKRH